VEVILHIGTDKTGSTSIQNNLFLNRAWLTGHSIFVPATGLGAGNGHGALLARLDDGEMGRLAEELAAARQRGMDKALLSWEGMGSLNFSRADIRKLRAALGPDPVRVLVYLREQAQIIQSGHLQQVKRNRNVTTIRALVHPRTPWQAIRAFLRLRNPNRNYYRLLKRWQRAIPGACFTVRIYDPSRLVDGDVVTDFLAQLGVGRDAGFLPARDNYNESLDVEAAIMLESLQSRQTDPEEMSMLVDITQSVLAVEGSSTRYFLDESSVAAIRRHFRASNMRLARHFMGSESYPFAGTAPCWRRDPIEQIEAGARRLAQRVEQLGKIPTLMGAASGAELAGRVELAQGWSQVQPWGSWSVGRVSRIRFRVFRRRLLQEASGLQLLIEGRYYGSNVSTRVTVNELDFGEQNLLPGGCRLYIPVAALLPYEVLEVTFEHALPVSPLELEGREDRRELAFGIEKIAWLPVKTTEPLAPPVAKGNVKKHNSGAVQP